MKRIFMGLGLAVVFYFLGCAITGGVAGGIAGSKQPNVERAQAAGAVAGRDAVLKYRLYILVAAAAFGVLGPLVSARPVKSAEPEAEGGFGYEPFPSPTTRWP
jgi:hypothetical protein